MSAGHIVAIVAAVALAGVAIWKRKRLGFERTAPCSSSSAGLIVWASGLPRSCRIPRR